MKSFKIQEISTAFQYQKNIVSISTLLEKEFIRLGKILANLPINESIFWVSKFPE